MLKTYPERSRVVSVVNRLTPDNFVVVEPSAHQTLVEEVAGENRYAQIVHFDDVVELERLPVLHDFGPEVDEGQVGHCDQYGRYRTLHQKQVVRSGIFIFYFQVKILDDLLGNPIYIPDSYLK